MSDSCHVKYLLILILSTYDWHSVQYTSSSSSSSSSSRTSTSTRRTISSIGHGTDTDMIRRSSQYAKEKLIISPGEVVPINA